MGKAKQLTLWPTFEESIKAIASLHHTATKKNQQKNPFAVILGRAGGAKGGKARAASLSPERRKEIAENAVAARWGRRRRGRPPKSIPGFPRLNAVLAVLADPARRKILYDPSLGYRTCGIQLAIAKTTIERWRKLLSIKSKVKPWTRIYSPEKLAILQDASISSREAAAKLGMKKAAVQWNRQKWKIRFKPSAESQRLNGKAGWLKVHSRFTSEQLTQRAKRTWEIRIDRLSAEQLRIIRDRNLSVLKAAQLMGIAETTVRRYRRKLRIRSFFSGSIISKKRLEEFEQRPKLKLGFQPPPGIEEAIQSREKAIEYLEKWRWGDEIRCTKCGSDNPGVRQRNGEVTFFICKDCKRNFNVTTESVLKKVWDPSKWLKIFYLISIDPYITFEGLKKQTGILTNFTRFDKIIRGPMFHNPRSLEQRKKLSETLKKVWEKKRGGPKPLKPVRPGYAKLPKNIYNPLELKPYSGKKGAGNA